MKPGMIATEHEPCLAIALDADDRKHEGLAGVHGASPTSLDMISRSLASAAFKISNWD